MSDSEAVLLEVRELMEREDFSGAELLLQSTLAEARQQDFALAAECLGELAAVSWAQDDAAETIRRADEAAAAFRGVAHATGEGLALFRAASAAKQVETPEQVESRWRLALPVLERAGSIDELTACHLALGDHAFVKDDLKAAEARYHQGLAVAERSESRHLPPKARQKLGRALIRREQPAAAVGHLKDAIEQLGRLLDLDARREEAECRELLGEAYQLQSEKVKARGEYERALAFFKAQGMTQRIADLEQALTGC